MKVRNLKEYRYKRYTTITDEEANERKGYADEGIINAYIYPASGKIQAQIYGKELGYILNLITNEDKLKEQDGVVVYSNDVDYEVISIKRYSEHIEIELRKL